MLELSAYAGIPHLLAPVVTDMKETPAALNWCVAEMERRYRLISEIGARGITTFNKIVAKEKKMAADGTPLKPLPYIVIIIDELADLMMVAGKKVGNHHKPFSAKSARRRYSLNFGHATPVCGCDYRAD